MRPLKETFSVSRKGSGKVKISKKISCLFLFFSQAASAHWYDQDKYAQAALFCVPVSDMLTQPARAYAPNENPVKTHESIPFASEAPGFPSIRAHQCLFNEIILHPSFNNGECEGTIESAWYDFNEKTKTPKNNYYTKESNVIRLSDLKKAGIPLAAIPDPNPTDSKKILTLLVPQYERKTGITFSAGTRFVRVERYDTDDSYAIIFVYRQPTGANLIKTAISTMPKESCAINNGKRFETKDTRQQFVDLLKRLIREASPDVIPYVFGGSGFIDDYPDTQIFPEKKTINGQEHIIYMRPSNQKTYTGFDCSELVWRAANIIGMHYPYKNTLMIKRFLKPFEQSDQPLEGDLILLPGHVMVVADTSRHTLIEAAGYKWGYGKVHEIALSERFGNIKTYDDLLDAFHTQSPVTVLADPKLDYHECQKILLFKLLS